MYLSKLKLVSVGIQLEKAAGDGIRLSRGFSGPPVLAVLEQI